MLPRITVIGRLTRDPELRFTESGAAVCGLSVACNHRVKRGDRWEDAEPTYVDAAAFGGLAEALAERLRKGDAVMLAGTLEQERWTGRDGSTRSRTKVRVEDAGSVILPVRRDSGGTASQPRQRPTDPWQAAPGNDQPPF